MSAGAIRRLRGALGNALLWGAAWSAFGFAVVSALTGSVLDGLVLGVKFGIFGVITGAAFSAVVPLMYHGRRLSNISPVRFGVFGGILAGLFVPAFMQVVNALSGDGVIAWRLVLDDAPLAALFGGLAAGGSLWLAQRTSVLGPGARPEQLGRGQGADHFASAVRDRVAR